jgi:hypothetical protein
MRFGQKWHRSSCIAVTLACWSSFGQRRVKLGLACGSSLSHSPGRGIGAEDGERKVFVFFPDRKSLFFQKVRFLDHLEASKYLNRFLAGKVVARDPSVVCIKHSVQFRFCKKSPRSVWVFPLAQGISILVSVSPTAVQVSQPRKR